MDIWAWVRDKKRQLGETGQRRLATIIEDLPTAVCDMRHEQAEAMVPEGLALARDLEDAWVEIFLRHWLMQSRVLHRYQGRDNLEDCVSLLEFSHRETNRACPQSMCVVQDFANCYGVTDGPGYSKQRLAVTAEALERIDPSWPCFECISIEHASALQDAGKLEDAVRFIDGQLEAATAADVHRSHEKMHKTKAHCLVQLGRGPEALTLLRASPPDGASGESGEVGYRVSLAEALVAVGQTDEAKETLPALSDLDDSDGRDWLDVAEQLVEAGAMPNEATIGADAASVVQTYERNGALWASAETALMAARLAAARGRRAQAQSFLEIAERVRTELKAPVHLDESLVRTKAAVDQVPQVSLFTDVSEPDALTAERLPEEPEEALELVCAARSRWPDDERLATLEGRLLAVLNLGSIARRRLEAFVDEHPKATNAVRNLGNVLRDAGEHEALEALVRTHYTSSEPIGRWLLATSHERAGRLALACEGFREVLHVDPEADPARIRLCEIAIAQRRWQEALELAETLAQRLEPGSHDWDRMVAATALGRWDVVRDSAIRLGMTVEPGEDPIDEVWGDARIRSAQHEDVWATRTGPVTARLETISGPEAALEREGDLVLFDPAPVTREERGEAVVFTYRELDVLERGGRRSFAIDAVHPGEDALRALVDALEPVDLRLQRRSGDAYRLTNDADEDLPGVYLFASVPETADLEDVHRRLTEAVGAWPGGAVWMQLLEALGEQYEQERVRQSALAESLGM